MPKILLIDDEANHGWKEILEKVFFDGQEITAATTKNEAIECLNQDLYELIFLDLRFGEGDHNLSELKNFQGYQLLSWEIRGSFEHPNFATPVILFTASNKIWNIHGMLEAGADDFYIKEHPDQADDKDFSMQNFNRLKSQISELPKLGSRRNIVSAKIKAILNLIPKEISHSNIRERITEKLKIGYTTLFHRHSNFENEKFAFSQEVMAYICFWSILEEVVKDGFQDKWIKTGFQEGAMTGGNWTLKNGKKFIERSTTIVSGKSTAMLEVQITLQKGRYKKVRRQMKPTDQSFNYYDNKVFLSLQVIALLMLGKGWSEQAANDTFNELNSFRNRVDFIHSSVESIFTKPLSSKKDKEEAERYCIKMLDFIEQVIASPWLP